MAGEVLNFIPSSIIKFSKNVSNQNQNIIKRIVYKFNTSVRGLGYYVNLPEADQKKLSKTELRKLGLDQYKKSQAIADNKIDQAIESNRFEELASDRTKAKWNEFNKVKDNLQVANKSANKLGHIINVATNIANNEKLNAKQKISRIKKNKLDLKVLKLYELDIS